jgi:hypothetical protein
MDTLTHFKDAKYLPLEEALKQVKAYQPPAEQQATIQPTDLEFSIQEFDEFYRIYGATYQGKKDMVFDFRKALLDGGKKRNFKEWVSIETDPGWMVPSVEMYTAMIIALYDNHQSSDADARKKVLDMRDFLRTDFKRHPKMARNEVMYSSDGTAVIDDHLSRTVKQVSYTFDSQLLPDDKEWAENLFGCPDASKIRDAYTWLARNFVEAPTPQPHIRCTMEVHDGAGIINGVGIGYEREDSDKFMIRADIDIYGLQLPAHGVRAIQKSDIEQGSRK